MSRWQWHRPRAFWRRAREQSLVAKPGGGNKLLPALRGGGSARGGGTCLWPRGPGWGQGAAAAGCCHRPRRSTVLMVTNSLMWPCSGQGFPYKPCFPLWKTLQQPQTAPLAIPVGGRGPFVTYSPSEVSEKLNWAYKPRLIETWRCLVTGSFVKKYIKKKFLHSHRTIISAACQFPCLRLSLVALGALR